MVRSLSRWCRPLSCHILWHSCIMHYEMMSNDVVFNRLHQMMLHIISDGKIPLIHTEWGHGSSLTLSAFKSLSCKYLTMELGSKMERKKLIKETDNEQRNKMSRKTGDDQINRWWSEKQMKGKDTVHGKKEQTMSRKTGDDQRNRWWAKKQSVGKETDNEQRNRRWAKKQAMSKETDHVEETGLRWCIWPHLMMMMMTVNLYLAFCRAKQSETELTASILRKTDPETHKRLK